MKRIDNQVEFHHKGEEIRATIISYFHEGNEKSRTLMFTYKNVKVHESLEEDEPYWEVGEKHRTIIDNVDINTYKQYTKYLDDIQNIKRTNLVIGENVYDFFYQTVGNNPLKVHMMIIQMEDEKTLDGSPSHDIFKNQKFSKGETFNNLYSRVSNYYKLHQILPKEKHLNKELTEKYQSIKKWMKENISDTH